jgi:alpha-glucosidase
MNGKWKDDPVVYHVYPLSFQDSDGDGFGDLPGALERLDHLAGSEGSLGVDAVWLSPVYPSPLADYGYDITEYRDVDPRQGGMAAFRRFREETRRRGLLLMMDLVANHTSDAHPWFAASRSSKGDPKRDWYVWRDPGPDGGPPNNWVSVFGGSAWTLDERTGQYYLHSFLREQPDLNWRNPEVEKEFADVMRFWLQEGVDGFRLDAIYHIFKDPDFRNEPVNPFYMAGRDDPYDALIHVFSQGRTETIAAIRRLAEIAAEHDAFIVGETYLDIDGMLDFYNAVPNGRYAPFNFNFIGKEWHADEWREFADDFDASLPEWAVPTHAMGNHDRPRIVTRLGHERARTAAVILMTLRGMPFIYNGDELGMADTPVPPERRRDPLGNTPGFEPGRDPQRTPMQWDNGPNGGFTTGAPWLPVGDAEATNAAVQTGDPGSMLSLYRDLIRARRSSAALRRGSYRSIDAGPGIFAYLRETDGERVLVAANFSGERRTARARGLGRGEVLVDARRERAPGDSVDPSALDLGPFGAAVVRIS